MLNFVLRVCIQLLWGEKMTDDLVKRLRAEELPGDQQYQREARVVLWGELQEAASRIEALEAALREIASFKASFAAEWASDALEIARTALETK